MSDIFLSYVNLNLTAAEKVWEALRERGWTVWFDEAAGDSATTERVEQELANARCIVVLWSVPASHNHSVGLDLKVGVNKRNLVIARLDSQIPPSGFPCIDLSEWDGEADGLVPLFGAIEQHMRRLDGGKPTIAPSVWRSPVAGDNRAGLLFLCYRRDDTQHATGRLHDKLTEAYGADRVFMDIDSVPLGIDFVDHVSHQIAGCSAVVVMIGKQWLRIKDKKRRRRLDNEDDLVRAEIAAALQQRIPVIPVLLEDAKMPSSPDLPDNIRPLARRNGIELSASRWRTDVERLIKELDRVMKP